MLRLLAIRVLAFALERSGALEALRKIEVEGRSPTFRTYYVAARSCGASHAHAVRYASWWERAA